MRWTWLVVSLACGVATSHAGPVAPAGPAKALGTEVRDLVDRIVAGPEADRRAAAERLTALGPEAAVALCPLLPVDGRPEILDAFVGALVAMGPDRALGALLGHRSAWTGRYGDAVEPVVEALRRRRPAKLTTPVPLRRGTLVDLDRVPPDLEGRVVDRLPEALTGTPVNARIGKKVLELDLGRDGRFSTKVPDGKPVVLAVPGPSGARAVAVLRRLDDWIAIPAAVLTGTFAKEAIEVLDGDLDGRFTGPADRIRFGEGAFRPVESPGRFSQGALVLRYDVIDEGVAPRLDVTPEPAPEGAPSTWIAGLATLNAWRNLGGMTPQFLDVPSSRACDLHAAYCRMNGVVAHAEDPTKPGYTPEGARAGAEGSVWPALDPSDTILTIARTVLHRVSCMGAPTEALGLGGGPLSVIRGGGIGGWDVGRVLLVPAPGQRGVPRAIAAELPDPERLPRWYEQPHGYPISATIVRDIHAMKDVRLVLVRAGPKPEAVPGTLFTPASPYHSKWSDNRDAAYFVAASPLAGGQRYVARFTATAPSGPIDFSWSFTTE